MEKRDAVKDFLVRAGVMGQLAPIPKEYLESLAGVQAAVRFACMTGFRFNEVLELRGGTVRRPVGAASRLRAVTLNLRAR